MALNEGIRDRFQELQGVAQRPAMHCLQKTGKGIRLWTRSSVHTHLNKLRDIFILGMGRM